MQRREIVVLDAGGAQMRRLTTRLRRLGYAVAPAKTPDHAERLLRTREFGVTAAVIPMDLPAFDLGAALRFLRRLEPTGELIFVAAGHKPEPEQRRLLRDAGVEFALWEPVDDHALRFQANRALAGSEIVRGERAVLRAPGSWDITVWAGERRKPACVYTLSAAGAFLSTGRPSMPGARISVELPFKSTRLRVDAQVVMANVPGNLLRSNLPIGMGVCFESIPPKVSKALSIWAEQRLSSLGF